MYISLYTARQLKRLKDRLLWYGLFLASGGSASLLYNTVLHETIRWGWATAAVILLFTGLYLVVLALGALRMKDIFVAITSRKISYRLHFLGVESTLDWQQVAEIQLNHQCVLFNLHSGGQKTLNLTAISSSNVASRVAVSLHNAALKRNLQVNGFQVLVPGNVQSVY